MVTAESTYTRRTLQMHEGDIFLDGTEIIVITDTNGVGVNQYNEVCTLTPTATLVLKYNEVLSQFRETICRLA